MCTVHLKYAIKLILFIFQCLFNIAFIVHRFWMLSFVQCKHILANIPLNKMTIFVSVFRPAG